MFRMTLAILMCLSALTLSLSPSAAKPPRRISQAAAMPSAADMRELRKLGLPLIFSRYVPPGFLLVRVEHEKDPRFGASYTLHYKKGKAELIVQSASGGIGDIPIGGKKHIPFESAIFGKRTVDCDGDGPGMSTTGWMELHKGKMPVYAIIGTDMDPREVVKAARSLYIAR